MLFVLLGVVMAGVHTTFASRGFTVPAPQYGTHSLLTFVLVLYHILSVVFLKPSVLIRPSVPPSGSHKYLIFGLWSTRHTLQDFIYLLNYFAVTIACLGKELCCFYAADCSVCWTRSDTGFVMCSKWTLWFGAVSSMPWVVGWVQLSRWWRNCCRLPRSLWVCPIILYTTQLCFVLN